MVEVTRRRLTCFFATQWNPAVARRQSADAPHDRPAPQVTPSTSGKAGTPTIPEATTSYHRNMKRVLLSWSSGKDSAWALHILRQQPGIELIGLVTTLNTEFQRVAMHGTRRSILEAQAAAAELPLWIVPLPWPCSNEIYEQRMTEVCNRAIAEHIDAFAFGDLFLPDVRAYRERQLKPTGIEPIFPLWDIPTDE